MRTILHLTLCLGLIAPALAASAQPAPTDDAAYRETIRKRSEAIVQSLKLESPEVAAQVQSALEAFYSAVSAWHDTHAPELRALREKLQGSSGPDADAVREQIHQLELSRIAIGTELETRLKDILTPEQIVAIKDQMTFNRVAQMTQIFGQLDLTPDQTAEIRTILETAREEAVTAGSSEAKHAVFRRYIGRINARVLTEAQRDKLAEIQSKR